MFKAAKMKGKHEPVKKCGGCSHGDEKRFQKENL